MPSNYLKYNTYIVCFLFFLVKSKQYEFHFFSFFFSSAWKCSSMHNLRLEEIFLNQCNNFFAFVFVIRSVN